MELDELIDYPSIATLVQWTPPDITVKDKSNKNTNDYISTDNPNVLGIPALVSLPAPDAEVVEHLAALLKVNHEARSIRCAHIPPVNPSEGESPVRLPLDIVSFWANLNKMKAERTTWKVAQDYMEKLSALPDPVPEAEEVLEAFRWVAWKGKVKGFSPNARVPVQELALFASREWFKDNQVNLVLDLLRIDLAEQMEEEDDTVVLSTWFFPMLEKGFNDQDDYISCKNVAWIRELGHNLATNKTKRMGFIVNIGDVRWTAVIINGETKTIQYGDSLGHALPRAYAAALRWWTCFHTGKEYQVCELAIGKQKDGHNCGVFACNAIAAHLLPNKYSVVPTSMVVRERVSMLLRALQVHSDNMGDGDGVTSDEGDDDAVEVGGDMAQSGMAEAGCGNNEEGGAEDGPIELLVEAAVAELKGRANVAPDNDTTTTKQPKSAKKKISSIRAALQAPATTLLSYFKKATKEERQHQLTRAHEEHEAKREDVKHDELVSKEKAKVKEREQARLRKVKQRGKEKTEEIKQGLRSPGGTKRKIKQELNLIDDTSTKRFKGFHGVAELSRPERNITKKVLETKRKPQGRKKMKTTRPARYTYWFAPFVFQQLEKAVQRAGHGMSATAIVKEAQKINPEVFASLRRSTVNSWIDRTGPQPQWKPSVLQRILSVNASPGHNKGGARGILASHPEIVKAIVATLRLLRANGAPLTTVIIRGIMVATIRVYKPEIWGMKFRDGSTFQASDKYVRTFVRRELNWSKRHATKAAQKLPVDWIKKTAESALRKAWSIKEYDIPSSCVVNSDQTQVVYAPGDNMTWDDSGSKQVAVVGVEEKRAITVMMSVAADGQMPPLQTVFEGKTERSLPSKGALYRKECDDIGCTFEPSGTSTYWSNQRTMRDFVEKVLVPFFDKQKEQLKLPASQKCLWIIDVFSVHRSEEFREYMKTTHPNIILDFVPGGCTSVAQPCDAVIQRLFKHAVRQAYHEHIVCEMSEKLANDEPPVLNTKIGHLRDASVAWLWKGYTAVNKPEIVKLAFKKCVVPGEDLDLSYETLTSFAVREKLRNLKDENPDLYKQLTGLPTPSVPADSTGLAEDEMPDALEDCYDDSSLAPEVLQAALIEQSSMGNVELAADGAFYPVGLAEAEGEEDGSY